MMKTKLKTAGFSIHLLAIAAMAILFTNCKTHNTKAPNDFVKVDGTRFTIGGKPYYYIGANFWQAAYLGANMLPGGRERLIRELDLLKSHGITNLRVMASAEKSALEMSVNPAFVLSPGQYNEDLLKGLDYLLEEMHKRNMRAVMCMNNYWQWSGGMSQYINWSTGDSIIDPDASGNWEGFMIFSARFYEDKDAQTMFFNYLKTVIGRVNTINQIAYVNDPTIMSWELANEPRPNPLSVSDSTLFQSFYKWADTTSKFIHSLAPNQLVTTGNEGLAGSLYNTNCFTNLHHLPGIDYITIHIWPKNWGWYKATNPTETFDPTIQNFFGYIEKHLGIARELNKPIVLEEFGFERDSGSFSKTSTLEYRNRFYDIVFRTMTDSAMTGSPLVGANFWAWGGEGTAASADYKWLPNSDFTGDPPQEPQGLNSIFSTDTSTLSIIKKYTTKLSTIQ